METNKTLMIVLVVAVAILLVSFIAESITGYGIKDWLRGKPSKPDGCTSNGYECGDCIDNDGDDKIDYNVLKNGKVKGDPDCTSLTDNTEAPCVPACNSNSECGTNGYIGDPYCGADGNVYKDYRIYTCYNPGQCTASCDSQTNSYLWENCLGGGCSDGVCGSGPADSCYDSDGGAYPAIAGNVTGYWNNGVPYNFADYCEEGSNSTHAMMYEFRCIGTSSTADHINCLDGNYTGCANGACY